MIIEGCSDPFKEYTSISRIEKCKEIMDAKEVMVFEKINGSNFRIKVTKEGLLLGSRELTYDPLTNNNFSEFMPIFREMNSDKFYEVLYEYFPNFNEAIIFGEVYGGGKRHGTTYKEKHAFRVFDICVDGVYIDFKVVNQLADLLGLSTVPVLYQGVPDYEVFLSLVGKSSLTVEKDTGEGIVIKAYGYHKSSGSPLFAKMVSEKFAEVKNAPKPVSAEKMAEREVCNSFASSYVTEPRVYKLVEKLKEKNQYTGDMSDMQFLIPLLWADLEKEEFDVLNEYNEKGISVKMLNGACTKLLGKIYATMKN